MIKVLGVLVVIAVVSGWVREHVPAGLLAAVGEGVPALLVVVAVLTLIGLWGRSRAATGAMRIGHSHGGTSRFIGRHEAGHYHAAKAVGGFGGLTVYADRRGGWVDASRTPNDPVKRIAVFRAGEFAVGSRSGCGYDRDAVKRIVRGVPAADRARVLRDGEALGRRVVRSRSGAIRRDGKIIAEKGTL